MKALSELLKKLRDQEKRVLDEFKITHAPTIGKMYEGLTRDLLNRINLEKYGVKVVSGFMEAGTERSGQIDCMVVVGEGKRVPQTDDFIYPISQVLAVIEVKKTLLGPEMADAYDHLNQALRLAKTHYRQQQIEGKRAFSTARAEAEYLWLFGERAPRYEDNRTLPLHKRAVYNALVDDFLTPVRIAIGYNGFKTEQNFRNSIDNLYKNKANTPGYGVVNMPNLMISDSFSIIKTNGLPYRGYWTEEDGWEWLASSSSNPLVLILELLYDRIDLTMSGMIDRGLDLQEEVLHPLALAEYVRTEQHMGWHYRVIKAPLPIDEAHSHDWTPLEISGVQKKFLDLLHQRGRMSCKDSVLADFLAEHAVKDVDELAIPFLEARFLLNDNGVLEFAPGELAVTQVASKWYCGNNAGGRFEQWMTRLSQQLKAGRADDPEGDDPSLRRAD